MAGFRNAALFVTCCAALASSHAAMGQTPPLPQIKPDFSARGESLLGQIGELFISGNPAPLRDRAAQSTLSKEDAALYRVVFTAQKDGRFGEADAALARISNPLLLGHVLYQRYMHPDYKSGYEELAAWMERWADLPGAEKIHGLAQRRKPDGAPAPKSPQTSAGLPALKEPTMRAAKPYQSARTRTPEMEDRARSLLLQAYSVVRDGDVQDALAMTRDETALATLDTVEIDLIKGEVAAAMLYNGDADNALILAADAVARSGLYVPKAAWAAGLVRWSMKDYSAAAQYLEVTAKSPYASGWMASAAAYWAARSYMRAGSVEKVSGWLERGMEYPRTFYGLISTRALGVDFDFNWKMPTFTKGYHDTLVLFPAGARAIALAKAGQQELAQQELLRLKPETPEQTAAFLAFAGYANLPALSMRIAGALASAQDAGVYDAAFYPLIPWEPEGGWSLDPALLHAIMKQESRFNPRARSPSGAHGLMQLLPSTAQGLTGEQDADRLDELLDDPAYNLKAGQDYLQTLLDLPAVDGNLLYLLIAYNAGPGNLIKWKKLWPDVEDPLLFIELIPSAETRNYIERVLANYWIYRMRAGKDVPTLDSIAAGKAAMYTSSR